MQAARSLLQAETLTQLRLELAVPPVQMEVIRALTERPLLPPVALLPVILQVEQAERPQRARVLLSLQGVMAAIQRAVIIMAEEVVVVLLF